MKGIYILIIRLSEDTDVNIGALGKLSYTKGYYAYVGSAQTNLEKRIKRHLRKKKRKFWHIDYLLENPTAKVLKVFVKQADKKEECKAASEISKQSDSIVGFGASDCNCRSHLFRIENLSLFENSLQKNNFETMHIRDEKAATALP